MITITLSTKNILDRNCDAYAFFVEHGFDFAHLAKTAKTLYPYFEDAAKQRGFTGKAQTSLLLNGIQGKKGVDIILIGLGDLKSGYGNVENFRRAVGQLVRIAENQKFARLAIDLPNPAVLGLSHRRLAEETATIVYKAAYHFDEFITNNDRKFTWDIECVMGLNQSATKADFDSAQEGIDTGMVIADAINSARYWCDMPPSQLTPAIFAEQAQHMANDYGLKATVFDKKAIVKMNMGGIEGVCRGSVNEPRLVVLEYKSKKANAETIALVGKGVTFDSGGLCIKPSAAMETMKDDMAGAAIVLSAMKLIAQLKPDVNVVAVAPLVENMPSGSSIKPGDILRTYNGKTIEVLDTDAEGRLILADALAYAADVYKPHAMIDLATLTGACAYALGVFYAGLMSQHDELTARVMSSAEHSGDRLWRLPMDDDYKPAVRSDIADVKNIGSKKYMAGTITAAFFLQNFVGNVPWVHLDIAGTAFGVPDLSYLRPGATGFGIRLIADLVRHWNEKRESNENKAMPVKTKAESVTKPVQPVGKKTESVKKPVQAKKAETARKPSKLVREKTDSAGKETGSVKKPVQAKKAETSKKPSKLIKKKAESVVMRPKLVKKKAENVKKQSAVRKKAQSAGKPSQAVSGRAGSSTKKNAKK